MVMRANVRGAVIAASGGQRGAKQGIDAWRVFRNDGHVQRAIKAALPADPEVRSAVTAETGSRRVIQILLHFADQRTAARACS